MHRLCTSMAIAIAVAVAPLASASAKKRSRPPPERPPVIIDDRDRSLYRPPPLPNEGGRRYYEPQSGPQAPMPRVPTPAPLDPGIRR